jgi:hypothetical protein
VALPVASVVAVPAAVFAPVTLKATGAFGKGAPSRVSVAVTERGVPTPVLASAGASVIANWFCVAPRRQSVAGLATVRKRRLSIAAAES